MSAQNGWPRLRGLGVVPRLGVVCLVLVILGGVAASAAHLYLHYENRDERRGLTLDDVRAAYRGLTTTSTLLAAVQRGHPETMGAADRDALTRWLTGPRVAQDYDNLDLGDRAPVDVIAKNCLSCHSRKADDARAGPAKAILLDQWSDVQPRAISKQVNPMDRKVMVASTHAHALSLATLTLTLCGLLVMTSWPRALLGLLIGVLGIALLADMGSWWLASWSDSFTYVIAAAGMAYNGGVVVGCLLVLLDLCRPKP